MQDENAERQTKPPKRGLTAKHVLLILIMVGVAFRVTSLVNRDVGFDANYFLTMGQSLVKHGEFWMPWGDPSNLNGVPSYSHHISPLFPAYLSVFYAAFGNSYELSKIAALVVSLLAIAVAFWATRDLYGTEKALVAAAIFALDFELIIETGKLYSENMTFLFFTLTMWAIIRGVKNDRYIVLAGLFAGLAYLVRSSLGYFFIIAGIGGFLWRFYYIRWGVLRNKWYLAAITIFLGFVGGWGLRNIYRFGWPNWETSASIQATVGGALSQPILYFGLILLLVPFFVFILLMYGAFWLPELKSTVRRLKDEQISGLWLAVFLIPFIALFISGALSIGETQKGVSLFWRDRVRYIFYAFIPLVWLGIREVDFRLNRSLGELVAGLKIPFSAVKLRFREILRNRLWLGAMAFLLVAAVVSLLTMGGWLAAFLFVAVPASLFRSPRKRFAIFLAVLLVFSVEAGTAEVKFAAPRAAMDVNSLLKPGEVVAVDGPTWNQVYFLYPFVSDAENRVFSFHDHPSASYIFSYNTSGTYPGYTAIGNYSDESRGGLISESWAALFGHTTLVTKLTVVLWKHN